MKITILETSLTQAEKNQYKSKFYMCVCIYMGGERERERERERETLKAALTVSIAL